MENILNSINSRCVSLNETEKKRNNAIVHKVIEAVLTNLQNDVLFKSLYEKKFYGGSFYDGLKVGNPNEYDIDMLLVLPQNVSPKVTSSDAAGYVHITLPELEKLDEKFKGLEKLCDPKTKQISAKKTLSWMESLMTKCFNKSFADGKVLSGVSLDGNTYDVTVKLIKSGPASTMNITAIAKNKSVIKMDVDLVPCLLFSNKSWPSKSSGYRQYNSSSHGPKDTFFVVPKLPKGENRDFYWRLSFQEQERELISGNNLGRLKPALRLLKKIRDHWNHPISSYFIKTVFLWEVETRSKGFWESPLSTVFRGMLEVYGERLKNGSIEYFWNKKFNLLSGIKKATLDGIANKINNIVADINRCSEDDPFVIAKHIVSAEEIEILRKEVDIGKKKSKDTSQESNNPSVSSVFSVSSPGVRTVDQLIQVNRSSSAELRELTRLSQSLTQKLNKQAEKLEKIGL